MNLQLWATFSFFALGLTASAAGVVSRLAGQDTASVALWTVAACALLAAAFLTLCVKEPRGQVQDLDV